MNKFFLATGMIGMALALSWYSLLTVSPQSLRLVKYSLWGMQSQSVLSIDPALVEFEIVHKRTLLAKRPGNVYTINVRSADGREVLLPDGLVSSTKRDQVEVQVRKIQESIRGKRIVRIAFTWWPFAVFSSIVLAVGLLGWEPICRMGQGFPRSDFLIPEGIVLALFRLQAAGSDHSA